VRVESGQVGDLEQQINRAGLVIHSAILMIHRRSAEDV
jgi:hypothetical protein